MFRHSTMGLVLCLALVACVEEEDLRMCNSPRALADQNRDDTFWRAQAMAQAAAETEQQNHAPPRSISLGFAGDGVLSGGITQATELQMRPVPTTEGPQIPAFSPHMDPDGWRRYRAAVREDAPIRRRFGPFPSQ